MNKKLILNKLESAGFISSIAIIALCIGASNFTYAQTASTSLPAVSENQTVQTRIFGAEHRDALAAAINSPMRIDKARDKYRRPAETLEFFGILPSDSVIEIWPGQGWYSSILGPYLKNGNGRFIGAHFDTASTSSNLVKQIVESFRNRFGSKPNEFGDLAIVPFGPRSRALGPENSVDAVLTFRNVHNWMAQGWAEKAFDDFYKVLKPGGILGIEEHRADDNSPQDPLAEDGYVREDYVIDMAKEAGFELVGRSQINANPKDTKDHPFGVWTLPPVGRTSAPGQAENTTFDKSRYLEIGESDRMTLLFRKPLTPPPPPKPNNTIAGIRVPFPIKIVAAPKSASPAPDKKADPIITNTLPPPELAPENTKAQIPSVNSAITEPMAVEKVPNIPAWIPKKPEPIAEKGAPKSPPVVQPSSVPVTFEIPKEKVPEVPPSEPKNPTLEPKTGPGSDAMPELVQEPKTLPKTTSNPRTNTRRPSPPPAPKAAPPRTEAPKAGSTNARPTSSSSRPAATRPSPPPPRTTPRPAPKAKAPTPKSKAPAPTRPSPSTTKAKPKAINIPTWNPNPPKKK